MLCSSDGGGGSDTIFGFNGSGRTRVTSEGKNSLGVKDSGREAKGGDGSP